jgi:hypothetical protein
LNRAYPEPEDEIRPIHPYDLKNLPEVEVAIRVNNLANVDTNLLKFEADFTVYLDWVDDRIPDGVTEMQLDWDNIFFNPSIVVENMEEDPQEPPCCSSTPQFKRPEKSASPRLQQQQNEWLTRNGRQCKWVSKAYRFRGVLSMPEVDLSCFPFDYQMLPLKVRTNRITFGDINNAFVRFASSASSAPRVRRLCRQYNSREAKFRHQGSYCASSPSDTCTADSMVEFKIFGLFSFPARSLLDARGEAHQVTVVVKRPVLGHNFGDLVVLISLTLLSCVSFWDSAPELSSRMSITLTLILTVAAYTSQRPAAIEKVPYSTLQDQAEILAMVFVIFVAVMNVISVTLCGGENEEAPAHMQESYQNHSDGVCAYYGIGLRRIDYISLFFFLGLVLVVTILGILALRIRRQVKLRGQLKEAVELMELGSGGSGTSDDSQEDAFESITALSSLKGSSLREQKSWATMINQKVERVLEIMDAEHRRAKGESNEVSYFDKGSSSTFGAEPSSRDSGRISPEPAAG